jgi:hypothetical protein
MTRELGSGAAELYDLQEDPQQQHDLSGDPGRRALLRDLDALLAARPDDRLAASLPRVGLA